VTATLLPFVAGVPFAAAHLYFRLVPCRLIQFDLCRSVIYSGSPQRHRILSEAKPSITQRCSPSLRTWHSRQSEVLRARHGRARAAGSPPHGAARPSRSALNPSFFFSMW
jgi:hypothetical protein